MKTVGSALHDQDLPSLEKNDTKHMLRLANDSAWASVVFILNSELQELWYAFGRCDLKECALHGAIMDQTKDWLLANADRDFASLKSVSANCLPSLRFHRALPIQPQATMDSLTSLPITAPLRWDGRQGLATQIDGYPGNAIAGRPSLLRTTPTRQIAANAIVRRAHAIHQRISQGAAA